MIEIFTNNLLFQRAETALLGEKANKLFGIAKYLDSCLVDVLKNGEIELGQNKEEIIQQMYNQLAPTVDKVCDSFPGLGAGFLSKDLDCAVVYGPTSIYKDKTGYCPEKDHVGRRCMETRRPVMAIGTMVRGEIMNCLVPVIRNDTVLGCVWANETVEDIYEQMTRGGMNVFLSPDIEPLLGLAGLVMMGCRTLLNEEKTIGTLQRHIRFFINSLQLSVIVADEKGIIRFASKNLKDLGLVSDSLLDLPAEKVFSDMGLGDWKQMLKQLRASGGTYQFDTTSLGTHETKMNVVMASLVDEQGHCLGFITVLQDMTTAMREEERLYRAEAVHSVEQLAVSMIHEIRNPLTILREAIRIIPRRLEDKQYLQKFTEVAFTEIRRVEKVTQSLSEFCRYSLPEFLEFNIVEMIEKAVNFVRGMAEEQNVAIEEYYECSEPFINGDPEHLHQAILNILLNSLQAMSEGGTLSISVNGEKDSKLVYVQIKDTGPGIKPEIENAIFRPFYTTKANGTGLGLALVQSIISRHNGLLSLEPGYGSGAIFTIGLPRQGVLKCRAERGEFR